jgi:6,7-dimethyl-8-ribityllumazine synthase
MKRIDPQIQGQGVRVGLVHSRFNEPIVNQMRDACVAELLRLGVHEADITLASVPGALEIPVALQAMASRARVDALIAIGAVIRGETYHFEVVANESCRGITEVSLQTGIPIANGILTTETDEQALARVAEKGADCARVAVEMTHCLRAIKSMGTGAAS